VILSTAWGSGKAQHVDTYRKTDMPFFTSVYESLGWGTEAFAFLQTINL